MRSVRITVHSTIQMEEFNTASKSRRKVILLAEDDQDDVFLFQEILGKIDQNIDIKVVSNGLEAIFSLMEPPMADVIFLDINMPRMNGIECLRRIRNVSKDIPVIILTTSGNEELINQVKELGASGFVSKPGAYSKFQTVMNDILAIDWKKNSPAFYLKTK